MSSAKITLIGWKDLSELPGKEGNPWGVQPTRAMILGLEQPVFRTYKISGVPTDFHVTYDRDYAIAWSKRKLGFVSGLPSQDKSAFMAEVFSGEF